MWLELDKVNMINCILSIYFDLKIFINHECNFSDLFCTRKSDSVQKIKVAMSPVRRLEQEHVSMGWCLTTSCLRIKYQFVDNTGHCYKV